MMFVHHGYESLIDLLLYKDVRYRLSVSRAMTAVVLWPQQPCALRANMYLHCFVTVGNCLVSLKDATVISFGKCLMLFLIAHSFLNHFSQITISHLRVCRYWGYSPGSKSSACDISTGARGPNSFSRSLSFGFTNHSFGNPAPGYILTCFLIINDIFWAQNTASKIRG